MSRGCYSTRWHPKNVQFQCKKCNGFRGGEQYQFAKNLDIKYGEGAADELVRMSKQTHRYGVVELRTMIEELKTAVNDIKSEKGL